MSKDHRLLDDEWADPAMREIMYVRTTNADRVHLDTDISRTQRFLSGIEFRNVAKGDFTFFFENDRSHPFTLS